MLLLWAVSAIVEPWHCTGSDVGSYAASPFAIYSVQLSPRSAPPTAKKTVAGVFAAVFLAVGFAVDDLTLLKVFRGEIFFTAIFCSPWNVTEVTRAVLPQFPTGQRLVLRTIAPKPKHRNT